VSIKLEDSIHDLSSMSNEVFIALGQHYFNFHHVKNVRFSTLERQLKSLLSKT